MRRIEIMGPPGVGKTTLFRMLCDGRDMSAPAFFRFEEIRRHFGDPRWCAEFLAFVDRAYATLPADVAVHARRHRCTTRAASRARKIEATPGDLPVLVDEGLCQRGLSLALSKPGHGDARAYFEAMPLPAHTILLMADVEVLARRNAERARAGGKDRSRDSTLTLDGCRIASEVLARRGASFSHVDASVALPDVASLVARLLDIAA